MTLTFDPSTHIYRLGDKVVPSVTRIIEPLMDTEWYTDEGAKRGTMVHRGIHVHELGLLEEVPDELFGYLNAWIRFKKESDFSVGWTEHMMYSELGFCGTADVLGCFKGKVKPDGLPDIVEFEPDKLALIDLKTSDTPKNWWPIQLAGYSILSGDNRKRYTLRLREDGTYRLDEWKDRHDRAVFMACLTIWQFKEGK